MSDEDKKVSVDTGLKVALKSIGVEETRGEVSKEEYEDLSNKVSQGVRLRLEAKAKEQNRIIMWKSRVNLVKHARALMINKQFSEAAVAYEKYLKVLEVIYELKSGELSPDLFNRSSRSKELTVITSVYWDLFRIYDTSPTYKERMNKAGDKLSEFLPYSKIFPQVAKALDSFQRTSKNPKIVKHLLKQLKIKKGPCFIATVVYDDPWHPDVNSLRSFRDKCLKTFAWGRKLVFYYYLYSPNWAARLRGHNKTKKVLQRVLQVVAFFVRLYLRFKTGTRVKSK